MKINKKYVTAFVVLSLVILFDQAVKIWVKTHMALYDSYEIASWFKIYFVENNGMAFGIEVIGKLFLTLFRIVAVVFGFYYINKLLKAETKAGYIACVSLILAGALGNIIDSVFYGVFFSESYQGYVASFVPMGQGYAGWLHGKVVDMLYFPLIEGSYPDWFPFVGGNKFIFFSPIFNIADSAISVGIFILLIFYRKTLSESLQKTNVDEL
ncbi:MAG: Lipoprotein signal peptidase [Bacteroidetes bacterium]|jgi:signal peptidase II|nr:Lipoprotein signal peptidase [Bacteroidota bacterium]